MTGSGTAGSTNNFFPLGQQFYTVSSGTSHSTPAVSGACALLRQFFINASNAPPSPAMTKAYLMNSARYMTGVYANDTLWSASQGMGEMNLGMAFDGASRILRDQLAVEKFTAAGQTRTYPGTIADPTKPFRVTLAWTDAPGSTSASKALDNDLDLTVTAGANTYKGNVFSGAYSMTGGVADGTNNVESVFLPAGAANNFTVTVTAANIAQDAITNGGTLPEQDFALVIYNADRAAVRPVRFRLEQGGDDEMERADEFHLPRAIQDQPDGHGLDGFDGGHSCHKLARDRDQLHERPAKILPPPRLAMMKCRRHFRGFVGVHVLAVRFDKLKLELPTALRFLPCSADEV